MSEIADAIIAFFQSDKAMVLESATLLAVGVKGWQSPSEIALYVKEHIQSAAPKVLLSACSAFSGIPLREGDVSNFKDYVVTRYL